MDAPDSAIANGHCDQADTHRSSSPADRENLNGHAGKSSSVDTQCTPAAERRRHAKSGLYVRSINGLKLRDRKVQRLVRKMLNVMDWLEPADEPACRAWAQLEILADSAFIILQTIGIIDRAGNPKRLLTDFRQLRQAQLAYERELRMTPAARIAIKANSGHAPFDLAAKMAATDIEDVPDDEKADDNAQR
jgi:hypothetical protein